MNTYERVIPLRVTKYGIFINYTYLIIDRVTKDAIVIDPAWEFNTIEHELLRNDARPIAVLLTHSHYDHVNLANDFVKKYNSTIYMVHEEIERYYFTCDHLTPLYEDGIHMIGSIPVNVIITPGHTAGSACYAIGNNLFTGDTLFIEGCGICWGNGANPEEMFFSLNRLKKTVPEHYAIFPGHSYGVTPGVNFKYVLSNNIYMNIDNIEYFVEFRMRKNQRRLFSFK